MEIRIKEICKEKGTTQKALASRLNTTETTLSRIAKGFPTSTSTLEKIAAALGVPVAELFAPADTRIKCPHCGKTFKVSVEQTGENE